MNVYVYYSRALFPNLSDLKSIELSISNAVERCSNGEFSESNIIFQAARIQGADVSIVVDKRSNSNPAFLGVLKEEIQKILKEFYPFSNEYKIDISCDTKHQPVLAKKKEEVTKNNISKTNAEENEFDYEKRSQIYVPVEPSYSFDRVIISADTKKRIEESLAIIQYQKKIFEEWGLYEIQPAPSSCLNFYGPSGTGKTMAAEAVAQKLGKKILKVSYADIESKYHGEGPKMVKAIFLAAEKNDAVLFIDEADSLLSKRLTNVTSGSDQAINSMRSQLLICIEEFKGVSIFATNLNKNYDKAFLTRLINIQFALPDEASREKIWNVHLHGDKLRIPLAEDIDTATLAKKYDKFSGREIRNAVISACVKVAMDKADFVNQSYLESACNEIVLEREKLEAEDEFDKNLKQVCKDAVDKKRKQNNNVKQAKDD